MTKGMTNGNLLALIWYDIIRNAFLLIRWISFNYFISGLNESNTLV